MGRPEDPIIAATEHTAAAASAISEHLRVLVARHLHDFTAADRHEIEQAHAALGRIKGYQADIRQVASVAYQEGRR